MGMTTMTLDKAVNDAFMQALQAELRDALIVTSAENFEDVQLPAVFVRATRETESIINSGIYQFRVEVTLLVQADDMSDADLDALWAEVLCVTHDITGLRNSINAMQPRLIHVFGILRDGPISNVKTDRHMERSVSILVHTGML